MVFQQGRRESGDRGVPSGVRRRETDNRERRWKPFSTSYLFDCHALGQIPWLIHIRAAEHSNMIRQELQWNRKQNR